MVPSVANVEIRQFWMEKLMEVPSPSFSTTQVPRMKKKKKPMGKKIKFLNHKGV
jgi:hypothetical protein